MTKRQRQEARAIANGEVYIPSRKPSMPSPKVIQLKTNYKRSRDKRVRISDYC